MRDYQKRMQNEEKELSGKIIRLEAFIPKAEKGELKLKYDIKYLKNQLKGMKEYRKWLRMRMECEEIPIKSKNRG